MIWYNSENISQFNAKYKSYSDLIRQNADIMRNYIWPTLFALAYPFVKWFFSWVQTWIGSKEEKTIKVVSGKGYIPTSKYLSVVDQYDSDIKKLSEIIERESAVQNENLALKTIIKTMESNLSISKNNLELKTSELSQLKARSNQKILNGVWRLQITSNLGLESVEDDIEIKDHLIFYKESQPLRGHNKDYDFRILEFICNPIEKFCWIQIEDPAYNFKKEVLDFGGLKWNEEFSRLVSHSQTGDLKTIPDYTFSLTKLREASR